MYENCVDYHLLQVMLISSVGMLLPVSFNHGYLLIGRQCKLQHLAHDEEKLHTAFAVNVSTEITAKSLQT